MITAGVTAGWSVMPVRDNKSGHCVTRVRRPQKLQCQMERDSITVLFWNVEALTQLARSDPSEPSSGNRRCTMLQFGKLLFHSQWVVTLITETRVEVEVSFGGDP